ncbi:MAG: Rrf2 family transcriptional regulator [Bacteroidales bacterium]|jgi:Rrf2 family protein|nr:Rrf2 family transcriptional regulator [Bacteroidales bacterium]MDD4213587.1 Rrf2 family transcriptional regulator [Bacteroidales bacterium]
MSQIVNISEAASIGIHVIVLIARSKNVNMNVKKLSELTGASKNHIAKVMQRLVKYNFVKSTRGPSGGFVLNKPPEEITLLNVYEALEGELTMTDCPYGHQICPFNDCIMGGVVHKVADELRNYFKNRKVSDMI